MSIGNTSAPTEHNIVQTIKMANGDWRTECTCGAHWTQPGSRSPEFLQGLFESHVAYAKRIATRTD